MVPPSSAKQSSRGSATSRKSPNSKTVSFADALTGEGRKSEYVLGVDTPEIVIAVTRPQGANDEPVLKHLTDDLKQRRFHVERISLAKLIRVAAIKLDNGDNTEPKSIREIPGYDRIVDLMAIGDHFRAYLGRDAVARMAILEIQRLRASAQRSAMEKSCNGVAFLLTSIVHPSEVALLRSVYKQRFFLLGIHQARMERLQQLEKSFKRYGSGVAARAHATEILEIDAGLRPSHGSISDASLNVDQTFHKADVFVRAERTGIKYQQHPDGYKANITRWLDQIFGYPFCAPTSDEFGMANAYIAAKQSVALGRSVGAAIMSPNGDIIAQGWNEPAHPGGGVSREGVFPDLREHHDGYDSSDVLRIEAIAEFFERLTSEAIDSEIEKIGTSGNSSWLKTLREAVRHLAPPSSEDIRVLPGLKSLATARLLNLIEFGRSVHAEMAAITSAARQGIPVQGATLFVTTFPCHECSRNIVAAGISRVVYVEPYGKSMASELYSQAINVSAQGDGRSDPERVIFEQFVGIAPSAMDVLFSATLRKHSLQSVATQEDLAIGGIVEWSRDEGALRPSIRGYVDDQELVDPYFEIGKVYAETSITERLIEAAAAYAP